MRRLALVATVTKIWDFTSNSEIIVRSVADGDGHRIRRILFYFSYDINCSDGDVVIRTVSSWTTVKLVCGFGADVELLNTRNRKPLTTQR